VSEGLSLSSVPIAPGAPFCHSGMVWGSTCVANRAKVRKVGSEIMIFPKKEIIVEIIIPLLRKILYLEKEFERYNRKRW
jgi:hypothetical protein